MSEGKYTSVEDITVLLDQKLDVLLDSDENIANLYNKNQLRKTRFWGKDISYHFGEGKYWMLQYDNDHDSTGHFYFCITDKDGKYNYTSFDDKLEVDFIDGIEDLDESLNGFIEGVKKIPEHIKEWNKVFEKDKKPSD